MASKKSAPKDMLHKIIVRRKQKRQSITLRRFYQNQIVLSVTIFATTDKFAQK